MFVVYIDGYYATFKFTDNAGKYHEFSYGCDGQGYSPSKRLMMQLVKGMDEFMHNGVNRIAELKAALGVD